MHEPTSNSSRSADPAIPADRAQRDRLARLAAAWVAEQGLGPPVDGKSLREHTARFLADVSAEPAWAPYAAILLSNELWAEPLAAIPFERRLLLLPQCLRDAEHCPARPDPAGLLCQKCGRCVIGEIIARAEQLGYVWLVAEGSALVTRLIESGQVEGVIGVSCIDTLRRVFPYMHAAAVPGLAYPLLRDGCRDTAFDVDRLLDALQRSADEPAPGVNLHALAARLATWFTPQALAELLGDDPAECPAEARAFLAAGGKRFRPLLALAALHALAGEPPEPLARPLTVAIECFHKASLLHDDIADDDTLRYGLPALHRRLDTPSAMNVGDYLLGVGYELLARLDAPPEARAAAVAIAARGHRQLCLGQGAELHWRRDPAELNVPQVLDIARLKTAPAFEVALRLGCTAAGLGSDHPAHDVLGRIASAIGQAYQIADDLRDAQADTRQPPAPNILLALRNQSDPDDPTGQGRAQIALRQARRDASAALDQLEPPALARLLSRVMAMIFSRGPAMECCDDHPQ